MTRRIFPLFHLFASGHVLQNKSVWSRPWLCGLASLMHLPVPPSSLLCTLRSHPTFCSLSHGTCTTAFLVTGVTVIVTAFNTLRQAVCFVLTPTAHSRPPSRAVLFCCHHPLAQSSNQSSCPTTR